MILVDAERRRGKAYFESDPASAQVPSMLVHTLERCIQEMLKDLEIKKCKVEEVSTQAQLALIYPCKQCSGMYIGITLSVHLSIFIVRAVHPSVHISR